VGFLYGPLTKVDTALHLFPVAYGRIDNPRRLFGRLLAGAVRRLFFPLGVFVCVLTPFYRLLAAC
jgi:hypothetical protein